MSTPTQRSLRYLEQAGYLAEVVERYNHFTKRRHDLFGFADIIAIKPGEVLLVQTTTRSNQAARLKKILVSEHLQTVLSSGIKIEVHGWKKVGNRWRVAICPVSPQHKSHEPVQLTSSPA